MLRLNFSGRKVLWNEIVLKMVVIGNTRKKWSDRVQRRLVLITSLWHRQSEKRDVWKFRPLLHYALRTIFFEFSKKESSQSEARFCLFSPSTGPEQTSIEADSKVNRLGLTLRTHLSQMSRKPDCPLFSNTQLRNFRNSLLFHRNLYRYSTIDYATPQEYKTILFAASPHIHFFMERS